MADNFGIGARIKVLCCGQTNSPRKLTSTYRNDLRCLTDPKSENIVAMRARLLFQLYDMINIPLSYWT